MRRRSGAVTERPALHKLVGVELTRFRCRRAILLLVGCCDRAERPVRGQAGVGHPADHRRRTWRPPQAQADIDAKDQPGAGRPRPPARTDPSELRRRRRHRRPTAPSTILPRPRRTSTAPRSTSPTCCPATASAVAILLVVLCWSSPARRSPAPTGRPAAMSNQLLFESRRSPDLGRQGARPRDRGAGRGRARRSLAFWVPVAPGRRSNAASRSAPRSPRRRRAGTWSGRSCSRWSAPCSAYGLTMLFRHTVATVGAAVRGRASPPRSCSACCRSRVPAGSPPATTCSPGCWDETHVLRPVDHVLRRRRLRPASAPCRCGRPGLLIGVVLRGRDGGLAGLVPAPRRALSRPPRRARGPPPLAAYSGAGDTGPRHHHVQRCADPRRPQAAAPRGPQRRDPDRAQAALDQDPAPRWARSTTSSRRW